MELLKKQSRIIDVRHISKTFYTPHKVEALVDVSTEVDVGEVVVVIGHPGLGRARFSDV